MTTNNIIHIRRKKNFFWDKKAWGGASYYVATLYKVMEWKNRSEVISDGEILVFALLATAYTAHM